MSQNTENINNQRWNPQLRWLVAMMATYPVGNILAYHLAHYLADQSLFLLIPVSFSAVPIIGAIFGIKSKLFKKTCRYPGTTIYVSVLYALTWLVGMYLFLWKVVPYVNPG